MDNRYELQQVSVGALRLPGRFHALQREHGLNRGSRGNPQSMRELERIGTEVCIISATKLTDTRTSISSKP